MTVLRILLLGAALQAAGHAQTVGAQVKGTMMIKRYGHEAEVMNMVEHAYELTADGRFFKIRMSTSWDNTNQGMLLVSDKKSLYQASRVRVVHRDSANLPSPDRTFATFNVRRMPDYPMYGWAPMEALVLAYYLTSSPGEVVADGKLADDMIPGIFMQTARDVRLPEVRTQVVKETVGGLRVLFWAVAPGAYDIELVERPEKCFPLGELRIEEAREGLPAKLYFVANNLHVITPAGQPRLASPLSDAKFTGVVQKLELPPGYFSEVAYDAGATAAVTDLRFPAVPRMGYKLTPGEALPFDFSGEVENIATSTLAAIVNKNREAGEKRNVAFAMLGVAICGLGVIGFGLAFRKIKESQKNK